MILSASRRTDIPAFYSEWFFRRLKANFLCVRNPMNIHQVSRISPLTPDVIDGIVFWSKNPAPMINRLKELDGYNYYFQFTLNAYGIEIEPYVPSTEDSVKTFQRLGQMLGERRIIWRYDPVFFSDRYTLEFHVEAFRRIARNLSGYTDTCVISFLDHYRHIAANLRALGIEDENTEKQRELAEIFANTAKEYGFSLETCAEKIDLSEYGIKHAHCIDKERLEEIGGFTLNLKKDKSQREECGCFESIDIGQFSTCRHKCIYCYANRVGNIPEHNPDSSVLCGELRDDDREILRTIKSRAERTPRLLF